MNFRESHFLKFPSVDVVEASAGSGKTHALAKRYIQLIMDSQLEQEEIPLKTILAITFTNKATIEMKERILEFLKKLALDTFSDKEERKDLLLSLPLAENKAKKTADKIIENIISHYNFFQVQTIDSFINMLLSGCAFQLGLASNFQIKENYRTYLEYSLDRLIDKAPVDKEILKVFEDFLKYYLFVENKEGWFSKQDIFGLVESLYNYRGIYGEEFRRPDGEAKDLLKKKQTIIDLMKEISDDIPEHSNALFVKSLHSFLEKKKDSFKIKDLSRFFKREKFPIKKNMQTPEKIVRLWHKIRENLRELCEWESSAVFKPYLSIFSLVLDEFQALSSNDNLVFLQELNTHAHTLIDDEKFSIAELYYRIATRLRHYLIDEFQDTNGLQWKNMFPMVEEALSSGGSLFYVGDKKQAIYRFRGGDVSLFGSVQNNFQDFNLKLGYLITNYRSEKEIVQFNNEIFSEENLSRFIDRVEEWQKESFHFSQADIDKILNVFHASKQKWRKEHGYGYLRVETIETGNADERNDIMRKKLISLVKELKKRFSLEEIAILARKNSDVKLFTRWLIEENISVESEKTLNIREHPLIKELISFLKFLDSPIDNLSFASFILGDIFSTISRIKKDSIRDFIFDLRISKKEEMDNYLYKEFRKRFSDQWDNLIDPFFKSVGFVPLYELVITILGRFKVLENFPLYQGFLMRLLEIIKGKEEDYSGISSFLDFFEEAEEKEFYVRVSRTNSVKITTIHKAKGLEFPVVIMPFLEIDVTIGSGGAGPRKPYIVKQLEDNGLGLVQLKKNYIGYSARLGTEYRGEYVKSLIDELNNLYVALTRAKYEMYLFLPERKGKKKNIACDLIPFETLERGAKREYKEKRTREERPLIELRPSQYSDWINILRNEFIETPQLINRENVLKGELFHLILSCLGNLSTQDKEECFDLARQKADSVFPYVKNLDEYISTIENLIKIEKFKPFFYLKKGSLYQEKEIIDPAGNTKRIDRLIITDKELWIVDYKSSRQGLETHKKQIIEYMNIIKPLYPQLKVRCFLIYLDISMLEEVYE